MSYLMSIDILCDKGNVAFMAQSFGAGVLLCQCFVVFICVETVASFIKEAYSRLAKGPLVFNGRLANRWLTHLPLVPQICVSELRQH